MFTWICPQCGREVPPSASDCPACAEARAAASRTAAPAPVPAPQPAPYAAPPPYTPPPPPPNYHVPAAQAAPPAYPQPSAVYPPPAAPQSPQPPAAPTYVIQEPKKGLPSWLIAILVTAIIGGGLFGVYKLVGGSGGSTAGKAALENVPAAPAPGASIYDKFIEVTGFRLLEDSSKKLKVRFTVVNHSSAPIGGLEMQVSLGRKGAENEPPFALVNAKLGTIDAYGALEVEQPVKTTLRVYELPDWQFIKASFVITGPR